MPNAQTGSGMAIQAYAEHRRKGSLVVKHVSTFPPKLPDPPSPPKCSTLPCIKAYQIELDKWNKVCQAKMNEHAKILRYHELRVEYAGKNIGKSMPEKYRTGDDPPKTGAQADEESAILIDLMK